MSLMIYWFCNKLAQLIPLITTLYDPPPPKKKRPLYPALGTLTSTYFVTHFVLSNIPRYNKSLSLCKVSNALFQAIFRNILRYTRPLSQCKVSNMLFHAIFQGILGHCRNVKYQTRYSKQYSKVY